VRLLSESVRRFYQRVWSENSQGIRAVFETAVLVGGFVITKLFVKFERARRVPGVRRTTR
jgi:hypothetical protein